MSQVRILFRPREWWKTTETMHIWGQTRRVKVSFHLVAHSLPQEASNSLIPKNQSSVKSCFLSHRPYIKVLIEYLTVSWQTQEKWQVHNFKFKKKIIIFMIFSWIMRLVWSFFLGFITLGPVALYSNSFHCELCHTGCSAVCVDLLVDSCTN